MKAGQIGRRGGGQPLEFLVVKMARHAEAVVALLGREPGEEQETEENRSDRAGDPERQAARQRAGDGRSLLAGRFGQRTVTVTGLANMM